MHPELRGGVVGIVLAGVHRWGRSAFDRLLPRPLMPVAQSPLMCYGLRWLRDAGIRRAIICANSESRLARHCLSDGSAAGLDLLYYEDWTPRGPAGCVRDAGIAEDARDFVVVEGTVIPAVDALALLRQHQASGAAITIATEAHAPAGADGAQRNGARPIGVYVFARRALEAIPATGYQDIKELLIPRLHQSGDAVGVFAAGSFYRRVADMGSYLSANRWVLERIAGGEIELAGYRRSGRVCIHATATVSDGVRFVGAAVIGPRTRIAHGATIVGPTCVGPECEVGESAVLSRSVIWDRCRIGPGAMADKCVIASGGVLGEGECLVGALREPGEVGRRAARRGWAKAGGVRGRKARTGSAPREGSEAHEAHGHATSADVCLATVERG